MKIAILNLTGAVGKTTVAANLLSPRMGHAPVIAVETLNDTAQELAGVEVDKIAGNRFAKLIEKLILLDDAIIDIGASNIEPFLDGMVKHEEAKLEFDCFIVPVCAGTKEQKDTMRTVSILSGLGIPSDKIKLLFNRVRDDVDSEFGPVLSFAGQHGLCVADPRAAIFENELYNLLAMKRMTVAQALADETDYKAEARKLPVDVDESGKDRNARRRFECIDRYTMKSMSKSANRNLDQVFEVLFGGAQ